MALRYSGDAFSYFATPNEFRQPSSFKAVNSPDVYTAGILDPEFLKYLEEEGGEIDPNDVNRFAPQGIFSRAKDFAQRPDVRTSLGFLLGGIPGAALSFFAPKIGEGISNIFNKSKPAPAIPRVNLNDLTTGGGDFTGATTGTGQDVSAGDLTSIGDTGFSEYSSPGVAASYEGSS